MAPSDMTPDEMVTFEEEIVQREDANEHDDSGPASEPDIRPDGPDAPSGPVIGVVTPS